MAPADQPSQVGGERPPFPVVAAGAFREKSRFLSWGHEDGLSGRLVDCYCHVGSTIHMRTLTTTVNMYYYPRHVMNKDYRLKQSRAMGAGESTIRLTSNRPLLALLSPWVTHTKIERCPSVGVLEASIQSIRGVCVASG
jgi:hypothetical protein